MWDYSWTGVRLPSAPHLIFAFNVPGHFQLSSRGKRNYPVNTTVINAKITMKTSQMRGLFRFTDVPFQDQIHGQFKGGRSHDHIQDQLYGNCDRMG